MELVDDRGTEWQQQGAVALPVVPFEISDNAPHAMSLITVASAHCPGAAVMAHRNGFAIGIKQHLAGIEAVSAFGVVRTFGTIGINLLRKNPIDVNMPVMSG